TFDHLADAILVVDPEGRLVLVNRALVALAQGPGKAFFEGMPISELVRLVGLMTLEGEPVTAADTASRRALAGERFEYLARWRGIEGRSRVLDISSVPILDGRGRVLQAVTVIRDITEAYELKAALEERVEERTAELKAERDRLAQTIEELHRAETVKGAFVNAISHDLRIPVTGLVGYAEFLEDEIGGPLTPEQREFVTGIQEAAARMTGLLDDLLDFARMEAHQMKIAPRPIRYADAMEEALRTFRPPAQKKGLSLGAELPPDLPAVQADPVRLMQVLSNLLSNAIKFTPEGGRVVVRVRCDGRECRTEVQDTGVGLAPEDAAHIFERFYQAEAGRRAGGTGLGLSIVKAIVEGHGGRVGLESQVGEGSTFWFTLPLAEPGP
ncbi:MAG: sensor histidine kinase, partial [Candidatus Sericytochromatia bacterium]